MNSSRRPDRSIVWTGLCLLACGVGATAVAAATHALAATDAPAATSVPVSGQIPEARAPLTLQRAVERARTRHPLARAEAESVRRSRLRAADVRAQRLPRFRATLATGLVPEARGDVFFSPDDADAIEDLGPFYRLDVGVVQPLYAFGRAGALMEAADHATTAGEARRDRVLDDLSVRTIEAFWGVHAAERAVGLAGELQEAYAELLSEVEARLEDPDSKIDDTDLLEVRTLQYEVESALQDALRRRRTARGALASLAMLGDAEGLQLADQRPPEVGLGEEALDRLVELALDLHPGVRELRAAVDALEARTEASRKELFPLVLFNGGFSYARAPNRDDQENPFVLDNFNYKRMGAFLGVVWEPNLFRHRTRVGQNRAEQRAAMEKLRALRTGVALEVRRALSEVVAERALLQAAEESHGAARSWLRLSSENWDLGIGEIDRMLAAYEAFFRFEGLRIERRYRLDVAVARLAHALGDVTMYVDWVDNGRVLLPVRGDRQAGGRKSGTTE